MKRLSDAEIAGYLATGALFIGVVWVGIYATPFYTVADRAIAPLFA